MTEDLSKHSWWVYVKEDLKELLRESLLLVDSVEDWNEKFHDYSFVVFPAAKAYEGFLKNLFLDKGFISDKAYYGKRFRVGKALNPALEKKYRKYGVYDKLVEFCKGTELPNQMWDTWKEGRNLLFHWFPNEKNAIEFSEAKDMVERIIGTMDAVYAVCKVD